MSNDSTSNTPRGLWKPYGFRINMVDIVVLALGISFSVLYWDGTATMASVEAEYCINQYLFVNGGFDYTYFEADGDMDATFYGIYDHTVAEEIDSSQTSVYATFGVRLGVPSQK